MHAWDGERGEEERGGEGGNGIRLGGRGGAGW